MATRQQNGRVDRAEHNIGVAARSGKAFGKMHASVVVTKKERAEQHQLRRKKSPHAQCRGCFLLRGGIELFGVKRHCGASFPVSGSYSYASRCTMGVCSKLCLGGGEDVCHSRPVARHGLDPARSP
ncbi:hypothetical protein VSR68_41310 [Paraburkholderia phymatum]|uniref:hypothetical protein n=1 Tax=Paraburkholderia phymatum TaxID=148447 RepID=UPI00317143F1